MSIEETERLCKMALDDLHKRYVEEARPYIRILTDIEMARTIHSQRVVTLDEFVTIEPPPSEERKE